MINATELIKKVSKDTGFTIKDITTVFKSIFDNITEMVVSGEKIVIKGFGTFDTTVRPPRDGVNPRTGEKIAIPETRNIKFSASKAIKELYRK